jgi:hypothetical protein
VGDTTVFDSSTLRHFRKENVMYKIKYSYRTGDSFHSEDREEILEFEWEDIKLAEEALKRIEEHYRWYTSIRNSYSFSPETIERPDWHKKEFTSTDHAQSTEENMIVLRMDNDQTVQFWAPWCGYFETLYGCELVLGKGFSI